MDTRLSAAVIKWPSQDANQCTMDFCFRVHYGLRVTAIVDSYLLTNLLACWLKRVLGRSISITTLLNIQLA